MNHRPRQQRPFDVIRFYQDYNISYATEGSKHCQPGWVQTECPFCTGNPGYHLGFHINTSHFNCWRCGWHTTYSVVQTLSGKTTSEEVIAILEEYRGVTLSPASKKQEEKDLIKITQVEVPGTKLLHAHKMYLRSRDYNPKTLSAMWKLRGTGISGPFSYRIIAPVFFHGEVVTFQGRDITGKQELRYKSCPKIYEKRHIKNCLYGFDEAKRFDQVVVVEGIADVWRLGYGAVGTFGIEFTKTQIQLLGRNWKKWYLFYDSGDVQAIQQAEKLANALSCYGGQCEILENDTKDPGLMRQCDANRLMRKLGFRSR